MAALQIRVHRGTYAGECGVTRGRVWDTSVATDPEVGIAVYLGGGIGDGCFRVSTDACRALE